jgi:rare lipoprotein A (peptidoglycan hydrolase)
MGKLRKTRNLNAETPFGIHAVCGLSVVALLALAACVFAASTVQADARLPRTQSAPSSTVAAPRFTFAPQLSGYQLPAAPRHSEAVSAWFRGVASWYGPHFNGHLAADGTVYDMYAMTAATTEFHPKLPLGTSVRVLDGRSGRSVVVRITDRGPLPNGRIIDLSYGAARKLAMVKPGTAYVRLHVLQWGKDRYHHDAQ